MAQLKVGDTVIISDSSGTPSFQSGLSFPTGHIIQVVQTVKNDRFVAAGNTQEQLITGYNCSITPHHTDSKILVNYSFDTSASTTLTARTYIERDIGSGGYSKLSGMMGADPGGSLGDPSLSHGGTYANWMCYKHAGMYLDSPVYNLGNSITYRIGVQSETGSYPVHVGSTHRDNTGYHPRTASLLVLMEIAQ